MLRYLSIQHLAVIERLEIEFDAGFTVLTGETGAGKSILVEAVGLLLGARASSDLVRTGEQVATIQAIFDTAREEVIVRREITAQGRSRAFVNGALATSGALRDLAGRLLEMHGQHEHQGLLVADSHLDLLDGYAGLEQARDEVAALHQRVTALRAERDTLRLDERQKLARLDLLTFQRDEIEKAGLRAGEDEALEAERQVLANAEKLQRLSAEAYELLYERDEAVLSALNTVWKRVADLAAVDPRAQPYLDGRAVVASQLEDLAFFLRDYAAHIDASPRRLQEVDDRVGLLDRLKRKYGPALSEVIAHAESCRAGLDGAAVVRRARGGGRRPAARRRRRLPAPCRAAVRRATCGRSAVRQGTGVGASGTWRWAARGSRSVSSAWRPRPGAPEDLTR